MKLSNRRIHHFRRQRGVVLFISLIMLVAMTLAGIALIRSVDTANQIAGNLAFKQGATLAADSGMETSRTWLLTQTNITLQNNSAANGYYACTNFDPALPPPTCNPATEPLWPQYDPDASAPPNYWSGGKEINMLADAAGNQVSYVIHRLCKNTGAPDAVGNSCINTAGTTGAGTPLGSSKGAGRSSIAAALQYYYRVTTRIIGPRNTVSYVQSIIQI